MKTLKPVLFLVFVSFFFFQYGILDLNAQSTSTDYKKDYLNLINNNKFDELFVLLQKWETAETQNPEMYVAWFNYYVRLGSSSGIAMGRMDNGQYGVASQTAYLRENVYKGISYLDKGLVYSKHRLDMYFGKISILNQIADYQKAGEETLKLLSFSKDINNNWLWSDNVRVNNGERVLLNAMNNYYNVWINAATQISLDFLERCTMKQIELYPQYIEAYNYLSGCYMLKKDFINAIKHLEKALTIDRNDSIVLLNLGRTYVAAGNKPKARECFNKVLQHGNEDEKNFAASLLDGL